MGKKTILYLLLTAAGAVGGYVFLRWGIGLVLPFVFGGVIALAAEPLAALLERRPGLKRSAAAAVSVTAVFIGLTALLTLLGGLLLRQAGQLGALLPELAQAVDQGRDALCGWLADMSRKSPSALRPVLDRAVTELSSGSGIAVEQFSQRLPEWAAALAGKVAGSALTVATAVLSAFMLSVRLPQLRQMAAQWIPQRWQTACRSGMTELRSALWGWVSAQLKLSAVTFLQLLAGFWLLRIPHFAVWAFGVTLVDAFPVLGTGTVLLPWSAICLIQGQPGRGAGLLGLYALVWLVRSVLEPRLLGKELGLDPLVTLFAMYAGGKLLGLPGLILAPLLAVVAVRLVKKLKNEAA